MERRRGREMGFTLSCNLKIGGPHFGLGSDGVRCGVVGYVGVDYRFLV